MIFAIIRPETSSDNSNERLSVTILSVLRVES